MFVTVLRKKSPSTPTPVPGAVVPFNTVRPSAPGAPFAPAGFPDPEMGEAADNLSKKLGISRDRQDDYAARSHRLTWQAAQSGSYDQEIVVVQGVSNDERPRPGMTKQRLGRLRPSFGADGCSFSFALPSAPGK